MYNIVLYHVIFVTSYPLRNLLLSQLFRLDIINLLWPSSLIIKEHYAKIRGKDNLRCKDWGRRSWNSRPRSFLIKFSSLLYSYIKGCEVKFSLHIDAFMYSSVTSMPYLSKYSFDGICKLVVTPKHSKNETFRNLGLDHFPKKWTEISETWNRMLMSIPVREKEPEESGIYKPEQPGNWKNEYR